MDLCMDMMTIINKSYRIVNCKVMPLYEKLEIKNLFDHDKLELEYQYE